MKIKIFIILAICLFDLRMITPAKPEYNYNPVGKIYTVTEGTFMYSSKKEIRENLLKKLEEFERGWDPQTVKWVTNVLYLGEQEYLVDHRIILQIASIESEFKTTATGRNKNGTADYGLVQVNDCNMHEFKLAGAVLKKHKIWFTSINNRHDIALGIMSAYIYLHWAREELLQRKEYTEERWIASYNCGVEGSNPRNPKYKHLEAKRTRYYEKYCQADTFVGW